MADYREEFEAIFNDKLKEEEEKLNFEDCVTFLQECLEKGEVIFRDTNGEEDPLNFEINKIALIEIAEKFLVNEKGTGKTFISIIKL